MSSNPPQASAPPPWRQFSFFDTKTVKDVHDLDSTPDIFKTTPELSTLSSSSRGILVADIHGSIHVLNDEFESVSSWVAHVGGRVTHMQERGGILVTLGEEDAVRAPLIKIWDLENKDKKTGAPALLRSSKIQLGNKPHPVTAIAVAEKLAHLAVGLGDGTVVLFKALDQSLTSSTSLTALPKVRTIHESPTEPITGLGFREPTDEYPNSYLYIVTTNRVLCYQASGKNAGATATEVDEIGSGLGCATMDWRNKDIVVARDEALYLCGVEGRGACYAYEGHKSAVYTHGNYLVIVSPPFFPSATSTSATVRNFVAKNNNAGETDITKVTVFDPENKLVAYSGTFKQGVRDVISQWGNAYILSTDGTLTALREKSTATKLDMLYRKSLYQLALNLAASHKLDAASVADIHKQYGDHLYTKGDYDGAMQQYVQTIGFVQPSYVIRKYLDAQRIHNLVTYLQELHSLGLANADHTTLLLNTYTKLKDVARLDSFIKTESRRGDVHINAQPGQDVSAQQDELPFDLDTAIRVCRQAGYFEHASYLAKKYERHEDYLRIQIEDAANYADALNYLRRLGSEAAESNLARYGRAMLQHLPQETTQLLIDLCTVSGPLEVPSPVLESTVSEIKPAAPVPTYLSYLAMNRGATTATVVSSDTASPPSPSIKTVRPDSRREGSVYQETVPGSIGRKTPPHPQRSGSVPIPGAPPISAGLPSAAIVPPPTKRKVLSPRMYFAHFVDHLEQFVVFLESVAKRRWDQSVDDAKPGEVKILHSHGHHGEEAEEEEEEFADERDEEAEDKADQVAVWNTLLELYLTLPVKKAVPPASPSSKDPRSTNGQSDTFSEKKMRDRALRVLGSSQLGYDNMHALLLCSTHGFTPGLVILWEKLGMYEDVLSFWMEKHRATPSDPEASQRVVEHILAYSGSLDISTPSDRQRLRHLYNMVLRFFTETPEILQKHRQDLEEILGYIDDESLIPPLGVVQIMSRNNVASVGLVKDWLTKRIKDSNRTIQNDRELTNSYRLETAERLKRADELTDTANPKVFHVTRCTTCQAQLDLPSVHFMCGHSYHQRCIADNESECPACVREHGVIREIRLNNEKLADQHEVFASEVQESGFSAIASAFSRGVLNNSRPEP